MFCTYGAVYSGVYPKFLLSNLSNSIFTAHKRSLGQGNVFRPVCHSVHRGGFCIGEGGLPTGESASGVCLQGWEMGSASGRVSPGMGGGVCLQWGLPPGVGGQNPPWILQDMVKEQAVRILLECILVYPRWLPHANKVVGIYCFHLRLCVHGGGGGSVQGPALGHPTPLPHRAPAQHKSPFPHVHGPNPPRHVTTCSTLTSLYRDSPPPSPRCVQTCSL